MGSRSGLRVPEKPRTAGGHDVLLSLPAAGEAGNRGSDLRVSAAESKDDHAIPASVPELHRPVAGEVRDVEEVRDWLNRELAEKRQERTVLKWKLDGLDWEIESIEEQIRELMG